jgi:hypothetical protein
MRNKQDITDYKKLWIALLRSSQLLIMTLFVNGILRGFSGLLHFVRNDGQRWIASIYDDAFCYLLTGGCEVNNNIANSHVLKFRISIARRASISIENRLSPVTTLLRVAYGGNCLLHSLIAEYPHIQPLTGLWRCTGQFLLILMPYGQFRNAYQKVQLLYVINFSSLNSKKTCKKDTLSNI